jgi:hypothetical protein
MLGDGLRFLMKVSDEGTGCYPGTPRCLLSTTPIAMVNGADSVSERGHTYLLVLRSSRRCILRAFRPRS